MCLLAKNVLAQADGEQAEQAFKQLTLVDQVMDALKNPSADHAQIYIALGIVVAAVAYFLTQAFKPAGKDEDLMFTLDQVVDDPKQSEEKSADDFYNELSKGKPYKTNLDGTLNDKSLIKLRSLINKRAYALFVPRKMEMMEERLGHYKTKNMQKYVESIKQSATEYERIMKESSQDALGFLDISEKNYEASFIAAKGNQTLWQELQKNEQEVRMLVDKPREIVESRDEIKNIYLTKIKADFDCEMRMSQVQVASQQEAASRMMIERTRVMDDLYLKFKLKLTDLMRAVEHFDLKNDKDVKQLEAANMQIKAKAKASLEAAMKLSPDQEKMILAAVASAGPIGPLSGNLLSFDDLEKIQSLISKLGILIMETKAVSFKTERRALLEDSKEQEYQKCIQQFQTQQKITFSGVSKCAL